MKPRTVSLYLPAIILFASAIACSNPADGVARSVEGQEGARAAKALPASATVPANAAVIAEAALETAARAKVGSLSVSLAGGEVFVTGRADTGLYLAESQVSVGMDPSDIPQTKNGNPVPGHFAFKSGHGPGTSDFSYDLGAFTEGRTLFIAVHVELSGGETAWAGNIDFPGKNGARYLSCEVGIEEGIDIAGTWKATTPYYVQVITITDRSFSWTMTSIPDGPVMVGYGRIEYVDNSQGVMVCFHELHTIPAFQGNYAKNRWWWGADRNELHLATYYPSATLEGALGETATIPGNDDMVATRVGTP
jgi:hypothetical protein